MPEKTVHIIASGTHIFKIVKHISIDASIWLNEESNDRIEYKTLNNISEKIENILREYYDSIDLEILSDKEFKEHLLSK